MEVYKKVDFGMWERLYGRSLNAEEKKEIGERMAGFARLLIQEDLRQKKETHQKPMFLVAQTNCGSRKDGKGLRSRNLVRFRHGLSVRCCLAHIR